MMKKPMMKSLNQLNIDKQALLVIDVQQGLFEKTTPIYKADELLDNINRLVERAHQADVPVIYIQHSGTKSLVRGAPDWKLHPRILPLEKDLLVHKTVGNAFEGTVLDETLKGMNVSAVTACGLVTHGCVRATCLGALKLGYQLTLVEDAHSNYSKQAQKIIAELNQNIREKNAAVLPTSEVSFKG